MQSNEIRQKFLDFFAGKGHAVVPSSSLIPDDPSVLLTTAGMQQFKPYFIGKANAEKDFGSKNTVSIQKSFRTSDIDEVGDESHLTFFEMLGNFSFGGYFKKEAIQYAHEFITKVCGLEIDYVSVFEGDMSVPEDTESAEIWKSLGISNIKKFGRADNFWGPTGNEGPCGPTTEIYVKNAGGKSIEIWNLVFNEHYQNPDKTLRKLEVPGVDTGMGLERLAMVLQKKGNIFETDLFKPILDLLGAHLSDRSKRIVADHVRGSVFLIADGIVPSNKEQGYVLRRLIRRASLHLKRQGLEKYQDVQGLKSWKSIQDVANYIIELYGEIPQYTYLLEGGQQIISLMREETGKFSRTFAKGLKKFQDFVLRKEPKGKYGNVGVAHDQSFLYGDNAFYLYQSFGFPREVMKDLCTEEGIGFDDKGFDEEFKRHQEKSRAGAEKKFGGHGLILDTGELKAANEEELKNVTRLHTATHLLQKALRNVLGEEVKQAGSDITVERTRFDFSFARKLTPEEIAKVEAEVNEIIKKDLPVSFKEMPIEEAKKTGALYFFKEKYPEKVKVYYVGESIESAWSKEFCGGPHVTHTGEIGKFKIIKEEAVGAGVRRVRGMVE